MEPTNSLKATEPQKNRAKLRGISDKEIVNLNASKQRIESVRETDAEVLALLKVITRSLEEQGDAIARLQGNTSSVAKTAQQLVKETKKSREMMTNQRPIWRVPIKEIPARFKDTVIRAYMDALANGIAAPFTMAGHVGWHFVIMPIPITIRDTGGIFYKYYCYFFTIVTIFGVRYILVEYAEDNRAQLILKGINYTSDYVLMATRPLINLIITYLQFGINKMRGVVNKEQIQEQIVNGIKEGASLARYAYCDKIPWYLKRITGCS